jgi:cytochrome c oxidase subunit 1
MFSFIVHFTLGGFTGLMNGVLSLNMHVQDTYFVVAHFHYVMFGATAFGFFGGLHYWFPKMFGKMYLEKPAVWAWALMTIGFNGLYMPMHILGLMGMPRRYYDYLPEFAPLQMVATVGSWVLIAGILLMVINLLVSLKRGKKAPANPWGGATLEWTVPSPPPMENFETIPTITKGPYDYSQYEKKASEAT